MSSRARTSTVARLTLACALAAFGADGASAQGAAPQSAQPDPQGTDKAKRERSKDGQHEGRAPVLRSETFRLMDAYVLSNIQESLGLTDEQFTKVLPLVQKLQSDRREFAIKRMSALRALRKALQSGTATETSVAQILAKAKAAVADERSATVADMDALDAVLTPLQQAKYRVFEAEVDTRLRHLLARTQDRQRSPDR